MIDGTLCYDCGVHFEEGDPVIELFHFESDESYFVHKKCYHQAVDRELINMDLECMN